MYIIVQYYTFCLINLFLGLSSHCAYDLLERRLHNLNEKDYSEVQTLVQVGNRLVYISFFLYMFDNHTSTVRICPYHTLKHD